MSGAGWDAAQDNFMAHCGAEKGLAMASLEATRSILHGFADGPKRKDVRRRHPSAIITFVHFSWSPRVSWGLPREPGFCQPCGHFSSSSWLKI